MNSQALPENVAVRSERYSHDPPRFRPGVALLLMLLISATAKAAEPIPLQAGPLSMVFEADNCLLRYIKLGSDEVLRGISAPVRNQFWATVPPQVKITSLDRGSDYFTLQFEVTCRERDVDFLWHGTIKGSANGNLEYTFDGLAQADFKRNRIGFCVLHGDSAAGRPWVLENTSGQTTKGNFPTLIAPDQPAKDLRAVTHEFAAGRWARVRFDGDVFEMEDQRNWTDASFKTYCTSLALPYPVQLAKGTRIQQQITLTLDGDIPKQVAQLENASTVTLTVGKETFDLPGIGLQVSSQSQDLSRQEIERLKALHLDHLRVDLSLSDDGFSTRLRSASDQANALGTKLIIALHLGKMPATELKRLISESESIKPHVAVWLVIGADRQTFAMAQDALKPHFKEALVGSGEDTNFTELNRNRPELASLDVVSYGLNPQVHAIDNTSMIETLPIQGDTVRSARQFLEKVPLIVSPVTLRVQQVNQEPVPGELPANVDPRQPSMFAAGWTLGSVKYLSESGVSRITYYETVGCKGTMAEERPVLPKEKFPARPGEPYPVYHVLQAICEFRGGQVLGTASSQPMSVVGLSLSSVNRRRTLVANLTNRAQTVTLVGVDKQATLVYLSQSESAPRNANGPTLVKLDTPLVMPAYGIAELDYHAD